MPVDVRELKPGDRVLLNCPKARRNTKREAIYQGTFASFSAAAGRDEILLASKPTAGFLASGEAWARFLLQRADVSGSEVSLTAAFIVEPDGALREDEGRRVFIERRLTMGQG